jgi:hypothetical protein
MSYSLQQIELATCMMSVLGIILVVAVVAFVTRSRLLFLGGAIGSFVGFIIPEPKNMIDCSSAEGAFLAAIHEVAHHVLTWGIVGAFVGALIGFALTSTAISRKSAPAATPDVPDR